MSQNPINTGGFPKYDRQSVEQFLSSAVEIDPVQPPEDLVTRIEQTAVAHDPGVSSVDFFPIEALPHRSMDVLIRDGVPYFSYYSQKDASHYIVHPMRTGRFLLENATGTDAPIFAQGVAELAMRLPNDGLAWFYPRHYDVVRMRGANLKYSAISQGTLIAGYTAIAEHHTQVGHSLASAAFKAMFWPFEKGGVNLAGMCVLEMPAFAGPPEIILNGWIDALLHIRDFADATGDSDALSLLERNLEFMSRILHNFDDPANHISRYSDVSPYRIKVTLARPDDVDTLRILYVPRVEGLDPILVQLQRTSDAEDFSIYENQIFRQNGRNAFVWVSCTALYDTVVLADSRSMKIEMKAGTVDRTHSAPGHGGLKVQIDAFEHSDLSYAVLGPDDGLICGYPTNFAKGGVENFYHTYHVVSLMLLATGGHVSEGQQKILSKWALKWLADIDVIKRNEGLEFRAPQDMLRAINRGRLASSFTDFESLKVAAEQIVRELND